MKKTGKCLYCNDNIPADKRADSKYCSSTCKAKHWEEKKKIPPSIPKQSEIKNTANNLQEGLRGVINENPKTELTAVNQPSVPSVSPLKMETEAYKAAAKKRDETENFGKHIINDLQNCDREIKKEEDNIRRFPEPKQKRTRNMSWDVDLEDLFMKNDFSDTQNTWNSDQCQKRILVLKHKKETLLKELENANKNMNEVMKNLEIIPRYEIVKENQSSIQNILEGIKQNKIQQEEIIETNQSQMKQNEMIIPGSSRIISSKALNKMDYQGLNLQGKWGEFFGQPSTNFHCSVHGKPGEGKSTFCIQFAHYLALNHGKTIYISSEEGFGKTLRDKFKGNKASVDELYISDVKSFDEIIAEIKPEIYHFIFIDSLDNMSINEEKMKEIRKQYKNSALITISQSTKDGKMRGSQKIAHDADITVSVADGIATTTKNRFKEKYMEFQVFDNPKRKQSGQFMPRNTV